MSSFTYIENLSYLNVSLYHFIQANQTVYSLIISTSHQLFILGESSHSEVF